MKQKLSQLEGCFVYSFSRPEGFFFSMPQMDQVPSYYVWAPPSPHFNADNQSDRAGVDSPNPPNLQYCAHEWQTHTRCRRQSRHLSDYLILGIITSGGPWSRKFLLILRWLQFPPDLTPDSSYLKRSLLKALKSESSTRSLYSRYPVIGFERGYQTSWVPVLSTYFHRLFQSIRVICLSRLAETSVRVGSKINIRSHLNMFSWICHSSVSLAGSFTLLTTWATTWGISISSLTVLLVLAALLPIL